MTNHTEMFADNIGEIVLTGALVRIDLVSLSATEKDATGAPTRELRQRIVMPVDGFVHSFSPMVQVMQQLEKHGLVTRNAAPADGTPAATICALYKSRWQVELFFKWIKRHLRIKRFLGTSENAVKTQIWIAVSYYATVAIVKKRLKLETSLYTLLQILSLMPFEKMPLHQALARNATDPKMLDVDNQLNLFTF